MSSELEALKASLIGQIEPIIAADSDNVSANLALDAVRALNFPGVKNEEWKYSPFSIPNDATFFVPKRTEKTFNINRSESKPEEIVLRFLDGFLESASEDLTQLPGVQIDFAQENGQGNVVGYENNIFRQLNAATANLTGIRISIAPKTVLEKTIVFSHEFSSSDHASWIQPNIQIEVGERAEVSFAELWKFPSAEVAVVNCLTTVNVAKEAHVRWINFVSGSVNASIINQTHVEIAEKSFFQHVVVALGEGYQRNNLEIKINGKEGDAHMYGLSLGNHKLHVDHHTFINHKAEQTTSNQLYKCILTGKSTGVFNGKILVDQAAQKTNAYQSSKNILLSSEAKIFAKPQLEIFADDVKCSHGATIGQLDEEPIFYLRSRGLDELTAKKLLIQAFASEILFKINNDALKSSISSAVEVAMEEMLASK